ncbi:Glioma pathogenesis-related protein 1 [Trichinella spiralis]|uniref:Glioma pathogenesis-related protein 1 n=1 Tax=Trichinella spiralis TaxID=6334 RepID=A0A0V1BW27_TRISP|nr:Glioma pathogenesis-related protein 1 [Trichinella spiralis]
MKTKLTKFLIKVEFLGLTFSHKITRMFTFLFALSVLYATAGAQFYGSSSSSYKVYRNGELVDSGSSQSGMPDFFSNNGRSFFSSMFSDDDSFGSMKNKMLQNSRFGDSFGKDSGSDRSFIISSRGSPGEFGGSDFFSSNGKSLPGQSGGRSNIADATYSTKPQDNVKLSKGAVTLSEKVKKFVTDDHNNYRKKAAKGQLKGQGKASAMNELKWSDAVAEKAAEWASGCQFMHSPKGRYCGLEGANNIGENLAVGTFHGSLSGEDAYIEKFRTSIHDWFEEYQNYDFQNARCKRGMCGHYTQMVSDTTLKLGCALSICPNGTPQFANGRSYKITQNSKPNYMLFSDNYGNEPPYKTAPQSCPAVRPTRVDDLVRVLTSQLFAKTKAQVVKSGEKKENVPYATMIIITAFASVTAPCLTLRLPKGAWRKLKKPLPKEYTVWLFRTYSMILCEMQLLFTSQDFALKVQQFNDPALLFL